MDPMGAVGPLASWCSFRVEIDRRVARHVERHPTPTSDQRNIDNQQ
jgi:hypothetical protein